MTTQALTRSGAGVLVEASDASEPAFSEHLRGLLDDHRFVVVRGALPTVASAIELLSRFGPINEASTRQDGQLIVESTDDDEVFRSNSPLPLHKDGLLTGFDVTVVGIYCMEFRQITNGRTYVSDANVALKELSAEDITLLRENGVEGTAVDNTGYYRSEFTETWHHFPSFKALPGRAPSLNLGLPHGPGEPESWRIRVAGVSKEVSNKILTALRAALLDEAYVYFHEWTEGDLLLMDNYAVLHGREAFQGTQRRLANLQVLKD
jgi:alpha-ketoglutarate-dependent taurine dioxygenase